MLPEIPIWVHFLLIAADLPVAVLVGWPIFGDCGGFLESLKYGFKPNVFSAMEGEWFDDQWATIKLYFWLVLVGAVHVGFAHAVAHFFFA